MNPLRSLLRRFRRRPPRVFLPAPPGLLAEQWHRRRTSAVAIRSNRTGGAP